MTMLPRVLTLPGGIVIQDAFDETKWYCKLNSGMQFTDHLQAQMEKNNLKK